MAFTVVVGSVWQQIGQRTARSRVGRLVWVHGVLYDLYCTGAGPGPTVVLEAGLGETLTDWQRLQPTVSVRWQTCSYDRAGLGYSGTAKGARDAVNLAEQLHDLLRTAEVHGPYVLVGHSLGGEIVRVYAAQHPGDVRALVLVDSAVPDESELPPQVAAQIADQFRPTRLCSGVSWLDRASRFIGYERLTSTAPDTDPRLPTRWRHIQADERNRWINGRSPACAEGYREYAVARASDVEAADVRSLGSLPVAVVTRGEAETWPSPVPIAATEQTWHRLQHELLSLSTCTRQYDADHARHYVMLDQPVVVASAIDWAATAEASRGCGAPTSIHAG